MAQLIPSIETILRFKVKPTDGELTLLRHLEKTLDDSYEVFFNPYLNGDRPDIIILRKGHGVLIIEVKDWILSHHYIDERKKWHFVNPHNNEDSVEKSPIDQVLKYKENLFDLHIDSLLNLKIQNIKNFNIVGCAVYFHKADATEIEELMIIPFKGDKRYLDFLNYNIGLIGCDSLQNGGLNNVLAKFHINANWQSLYFTEELYNNFKRILTPTVHMMTDGQTIVYDNRQSEVITRQVKQMRVKGVFGSGKTTVLVARAVQAYLRLKKDNPNPKILILTYNLTLRNFIHDKLMQVQQEFIIQDFIIINYHQFINAELNNMGIDIKVPQSIKGGEISAYLDANYYSNEHLFEHYKDRIVPYDTILIDEIQDYKRSWMNIIKNSFLAEGGEYMLFGDVKQNIYGNPIENKDVVTNIPVRPTELKKCYRSDSKIRDLTIAFQRALFNEKYYIDDFLEQNGIGLFDSFEKEGYVNYTYLSNAQIVSTLYTIVHENILNRINNVSPNDITILGYTTPLLREFDHYYRLLSREKTKTMFETPEIMYRNQLNFISERDNPWFGNIFKHLVKIHFPNNTNLNDWQISKLKSYIALLLATSEIYKKYPERLNEILRETCNKCKISKDAFEAWLEHYADSISAFRILVHNADYEFIRKNKKMNFWMNCGMVKVSTIHSFKGWESQAIFLIVENNTSKEEFNELLYTGITRARENLVVINFGNTAYHKILKPLFDKVNNT